MLTYQVMPSWALNFCFMSRVASWFMEGTWKKKQVSRVVKISRRYMLASTLRPCRTTVCSCFILLRGVRCEGVVGVGGREKGGVRMNNHHRVKSVGKLAAARGHTDNRKELQSNRQRERYHRRVFSLLQLYVYYTWSWRGWVAVWWSSLCLYWWW